MPTLHWLPEVVLAVVVLRAWESHEKEEEGEGEGEEVGTHDVNEKK